MQNIVTAAVLVDFLFDEFDGKDRNPFREKGVRSRAMSDVSRNHDGRNCQDQGQARSLLLCLQSRVVV